MSTTGITGTNFQLNLLEADPAGKYDIFSEADLTSSAWSDVLQGSTGQTNFSLLLPQTGTGFYRAARTDTPITNAANVTVTFPGLFVNTNLITALVAGGPAAAMAVLVGDTNFADARWIPFSAVPCVLLGTNDGTYQVWFGFKGSDGTNYWSEASVTLDTTSPTLAITNPATSTVSLPMIQVQGYSVEPLSSLTFDVANALGTATNEQGYVTSQYFDTNAWTFTTNYFQYYDVPLIQGTNTITIHATDLAGNTTTTNFNFVLDFSSATNPPVLQISWPQSGAQISGTNFTLRGQLDNPTASITVQAVNTNGLTNIVSGLVERDGKFWAEKLPLSNGTNSMTVTATDAAGNTSTTNFNLIQSVVTVTIVPLDDTSLNQTTATVTGTVSDPGYTNVSVNGIAAAVDGSGNWTAGNVPINAGGTACLDITASSSSNSPPVQLLLTQDKPPYVYVQSYIYRYNFSVTNYTTIYMTPIFHTDFLYWTNKIGGMEQYHRTIVMTPGDNLNSDGQTVWPSDTWPPTLNGIQTIVSSESGRTSTTNVYSVGPPSSFWPPPSFWGTLNFQHTDAIYNQYDHHNVFASYSQNAQTVMRYFTGGKNMPTAQSLHQLNVALNQKNISWNLCVGCGGGPTYSLSDVGTLTNGVNAGTFGALTNGVANKALPDGVNLDVTPRPLVPFNNSGYTFSVTATKHVPGTCQVSIQSVDDAWEPGFVPTSGDCSDFTDTTYGQTGHFEISRTGDLSRQLWVFFAVSGNAVRGEQYDIGHDKQYGAIGLPDFLDFEPGVSNLIVAVSPRFDPVNYGVKSVDIAIRPSSVWNTPPYYTIDSSKSNTTVYVHDSNVDVWTPHIAFFPSPPVQANGVVQGYGEFHREDYSPTNVCGSGAGGSDVGFGPFGGSFILVTRATLGTDFTFQSDSCSISSRPSYVFRNDADPYDTNKLEKLNFYLIQTTFCIGPHYNYGVCHNLPYLANAPFTLTVLPSGTTPAYKKVRLFMENPMPGLLIEAGPVPSLMQLGNGDVGNFTFFDIVN